MVSVMRLHALLMLAFAGILLSLGATGTSQAGQGQTAAPTHLYGLSTQGYAAADPMAGSVRVPQKHKRTLRSTVTENCLPAFVPQLVDPNAARLECQRAQLPVAALRDVRTMTSQVPAERFVLAKWAEMAGSLPPAPQLQPVDPEWVAMAEFGVPDLLPSQSGPLRAGFYSLF